MKIDPTATVEGLRKLVAEEMFLLGQQVEDSIDGRQQRRLMLLTASLDEACDLLSLHRRS